MPSTTTIGDLSFTRFVQSSFKVKGDGLIVYVDPHRINVQDVGADKADLILLTHPHFDHLDPEAIDACRKDDTVVVANAVCADKIKERPGIVSIKEGETTIQKGVVLKAVPGYNGYHDRNEGFNVGFVFVLGGKSIYHGGDTGKVSEMAKMGSIDVALVPIGGTYTMDEIEAAEAICEMIKPMNVIPMHYGYATGGDPIKFAELVGDVSETHILDPVLTVKAGE